jgi:hypothetical protein
MRWFHALKKKGFDVDPYSWEATSVQLDSRAIG